MLHGLEDCRTLGVDDAFQSELREGLLWKIACERLLLAGKRPLAGQDALNLGLLCDFKSIVDRPRRGQPRGVPRPAGRRPGPGRHRPARSEKGGGQGGQGAVAASLMLSLSPSLSLSDAGRAGAPSR